MLEGGDVISEKDALISRVKSFGELKSLVLCEWLECGV